MVNIKKRNFKRKFIYIFLFTFIIIIFTYYKSYGSVRAVKNAISLNEENNKVIIADINLSYDKSFLILSKDNEKDVKKEFEVGLKKLDLSFNDLFKQNLNENSSFILINTDKQKYPSTIEANVVKNSSMKFLKSSEKDNKENLIKVLENTFPERNVDVKVESYRIMKEDVPLIICESEYSKENRLKLKSARTAFVYKDKMYKFIFTTEEERFDDEYKNFNNLLNSIKAN